MALFNIDYKSSALRKSVTFKAILPNDYDIFGVNKGNQPSPPFRTVYLLHGYAGNCSDWLNGFNLQEMAQSMKFAAIIPSGDNSSYIDDIAKNEYFGEFIGKEIIEYTRNTFPLSHKREDTFIAGFSMGGYGAIRNALKYSDTFSKAIGFSAALFVLDLADGKGLDGTGPISESYCERLFGDYNSLRKSDKDPRFLIENLISNNMTIPNMFMSCGTEDSLLKVNRQFSEFLQHHNVAHTYIEDEGGHSKDFTRRYLEQAFSWMLG